MMKIVVGLANFGLISLKSVGFVFMEIGDIFTLNLHL